MNLPVRRFLLIFLFCAVSICAKNKVYLPPVQLEGVHQDYGERLVNLVRQYIGIDKRVALVDEAFPSFGIPSHRIRPGQITAPKAWI